MDNLSQAETIGLKQCRSCIGELLAPDTFCRWCGVRQNEDPVTSTSKTGWCEHKTKGLRNYVEVNQTPSKQMLDLMAKSVASKTESLSVNRLGALVITSVIAIPMWLLIILLSPLDAYKSAKAASRQMNVH